MAVASWKLARRWQYPGSLGIWAAPVHAQTTPGFRIIYRLAFNAGILIPGPRGRVDSPGNRTLRFINGSEEHFVSWERDENLLGPTAHDLAVDEAGLLTARARAILSSRRSATLGPARFIGNVGPTFSEFWNLCEQAEDPANADRMYSAKWTWRDKAACLRGIELEEYLEFIDDERKDLGLLFRQYYEAEWEEPEGAIFAEAIVNATVLEANPNPHPGHRYLIGFDVGQKHDFFVGIPLCLTCGCITDIMRFRGVSYSEIPQRVVDYCKHWNMANGAIEVNGPGQAVLDDASVLYPHLIGFTTTSHTKRDGVVAGLAALNSGSVRVAALPPFQAEMRSYRAIQNATTHTWKFEAPKGTHDDTVSAFLTLMCVSRTGPAAIVEMYRQELEERKKGAAPEPPPAPVPDVITALHQGQPVTCSKEEYPGVRNLLHNSAGRYIEANDAVRAQMCLEEIRRLDKVHGFRLTLGDEPSEPPVDPKAFLPS